MKQLAILFALLVALFAAAPAQASLGPAPRPPGSVDYPNDNGTIYSTDYLYLGEATTKLATLPNVWTDFGRTCSSLYSYRDAFWDTSGRLAGYFPCASQYRQSSQWTARVSRSEVRASVFVYRPSQRVYCHFTANVRKYFDRWYRIYVVGGTQATPVCATY
jgi:hypothetical protein